MLDVSEKLWTVSFCLSPYDTLPNSSPSLGCTQHEPPGTGSRSRDRGIWGRRPHTLGFLFSFMMSTIHLSVASSLHSPIFLHFVRQSVNLPTGYHKQETSNEIREALFFYFWEGGMFWFSPQNTQTLGSRPRPRPPLLLSCMLWHKFMVTPNSPREHPI